MLIGIDASRATVARRTGTETYSLYLIRSLIALESGHRFRLYTKGRPPDGALWTGPAPAGVEVRPIPLPRLWTHLRLSAEMLAHPPDLLFVPSHVLPRAHPRLSVATVHDLGYLYFPEAHRPRDRRYLDWSTGWNARASAAVLADSQATKADLVRAYGVDGSKVHVVYLGRDEAFAPVRAGEVLARVCARYGIAGPYLLYVGTLQPRKNLARLVEAYARLVGNPTEVRDQRRDDAGIRLVLAGKRGWLYDDLFARVRRLGLEGRVVFPGYVEEGDLPALYSGALAALFPSLYEGFGIPVLEAQACGVPVMTSNNSSLPEVAGDAALLVDPHDVEAIAAAMQRLATDEALRAELVRRGFENIKRFSWEKCARETLAVLESIVDAETRGRGSR
jgi:glycosyltransferase involved in cell wall biosynthesis